MFSPRFSSSCGSSSSTGDHGGEHLRHSTPVFRVQTERPADDGYLARTPRLLAQKQQAAPATPAIRVAGTERKVKKGGRDEQKAAPPLHCGVALTVGNWQQLTAEWPWTGKRTRAVKITRATGRSVGRSVTRSFIYFGPCPCQVCGAEFIVVTEAGQISIR